MPFAKPRAFIWKMPGRLLRLAVLGFLLVFVFQRLVPPLFMPVATHAVVSARVVRVASPIDGVVTGPAPVAGPVQAGQFLVAVEDPAADFCACANSSSVPRKTKCWWRACGPS